MCPPRHKSVNDEWSQNVISPSLRFSINSTLYVFPSFSYLFGALNLNYKKHMKVHEVPFEIPKDEEIKWELYKMYRTQKAYFSKTNQWLTTLKNIQSAPIVLYGQRLKPFIESYSSGWTISILSPFSNNLLTIREDGKFKFK